jgi:tRNA A37 methylthiotransferase MiaB
MKMIGTTTNVLWESAEPINKENCRLKGFSENYLPVKCLGSQNLLNQISNVEVTDFDGISLAGKIIS